MSSSGCKVVNIHVDAEVLSKEVSLSIDNRPLWKRELMDDMEVNKIKIDLKFSPARQGQSDLELLDEIYNGLLVTLAKTS